MIGLYMSEAEERELTKLVKKNTDVINQHGELLHSLGGEVKVLKKVVTGHVKQEDLDREEVLTKLRKWEPVIEKLEPVANAVEGIEYLGRLGQRIEEKTLRLAKFTASLGVLGGVFMGAYHYSGDLINGLISIIRKAFHW